MILALALLAQFVTPLVISSVWALAPLLRDSLHLTREQIGSLTALFFIGAVVTGIPAGWLADRFGVRRFLIVGQIIGGLPLVALPFLPTYQGLGRVPIFPVKMWSIHLRRDTLR